MLALLLHGADANARADIDGYGCHHQQWVSGATALIAAFKEVRDFRHFTHYTRQRKFSTDCIRSITHKAVRDRLPAELTDAIADQLIADITSDKQTRELIKMLIEYGADPTGIANGARLSKISMFAGGYEELWDDHLRFGIEEGQERVYEFDPTL